MPVRPLSSAPIAVVLSALALAASAQSRLPPGVDGGGKPQAMATRSVSQYLDLERSLAEALQERRRDAALPMLAADFELRSAESLDALTASDWLAAQMRPGAAAMRVRDLTVREFGEVAVVSFFLDVTARGKPRSTLYVVDVWRQAEHKLAVRYVSQPTHALPASARPRGRE
jgi:hypothetical protein